MGISYQTTSVDILKAISPAVQQLARDICNKIVEYNGKSPSAVFMIGGGSLIPGLNELIAEFLQIPVDRVGVRKTTLIKDVIINDKKLTGPEFITPIGIAVTASIDRQKDFISVSVNDKNIKLFDSKSLTVADALIFVGFNPRSLIGRRGAPLTFTINGDTQTVKGESGESAQIYVNGVKASLDKTLSNGDRIVIDPAVDGKSPEIYIRDYNSLIKGKIVYVNDDERVLNPIIIVNNCQNSIDYRINEQDIIEIKNVNTIEKLLKLFDIDTNDIFITNNGDNVDLSSIIGNGDRIFIEYNNKPAVQKAPELVSNGIYITVNGKQINIDQTKDNMMFLDIFNYIAIDVTKIKGINSMKLNGSSANYTDLIKSGDIIDLDWEK